MRLFEEFKAFWRTYVIVLTPLAFLPLILLIDGKPAACAYCVLIMAVYWVTEAIPLAATALLPMVLFPLTGVLKVKLVSVNYFKDLNFVFMGGLMMALSVEKSNLHSRIALKVLSIMGSNPRWLLLGVMLPTWFLSMWISNTATTAMMITVVEAVLVQLKLSMLSHTKAQNSPEGHGNAAFSVNGVELEMIQKNPDTVDSGYVPAEPDTNSVDISVGSIEGGDAEEAEVNKKMKKINKMLSLAVAYAANVGGVATMTGTPPNLVLSGQAEKAWAAHGLDNPVTWANWIPFGLPISVICLLIGWVWLQTLFVCCRDCCCCVRNRQNDDDTVKRVVRTEYEKLGSIRFAEVMNLIFFIILIILWFSRNPGYATGYASWFEFGYTSDAVPAMFIAVLLFVFPSEMPKCLLFCSAKSRSVPALLDWETVSTKLAWGPIFILGGGFALADACLKSGLSEVIADHMQQYAYLPQWVFVLLITTIVASLTEITSNTATTTLILPILAAVAEGINLNPLYLMLPATVAASMAFMLPIATPPNAIVFAHGHLRVVDMAIAGLLMNVLCILVIVFAIHTWGMALFDLNTIPWAVNGTVTSA